MTIRGIWELKKIAMRNLARHKMKTLLTSLAIMVSVAVYIFLNSWLGGMQIESRRNIVNYEIGAAKLQTNLYFDRFDEMPSYETFQNWEVYRDALAREGYNSAPRFVFSGTMFSHSGSLPMIIHGIDPAAEALTMRYIGDNERYIEFGRFVRDNGNYEIAMGLLSAERLRVGIPTRPFRLELEALISDVIRVSNNPQDAGFIRSLYEQAPTVTGMFTVEERITEGNERMILRRDASQNDLDRFWNLVAATDRNNIQISTMIEMKAAPQTISAIRWEVDLWPSLRIEDRALVSAAYEYLDFMDAWDLIEEDPRQLELVLDAMIRADYTGAVRRVNQLISLIVVGIVNSPAPLPNSTAFIPLNVLQGETGMMLEGAVTELIIRDSRVPDHQLPGASERSPAITAALERGLSSMGMSLSGDLGVFTWDEYMADYLGYEALQVGAPNVLVFILLILAFLGISNTILLAIMERTKETGMMRALGMTDRQMVMTYMLEAGFIGFIGSILGIILGCALNYPMVVYGWDLVAMGDALGGDGSMGFRTVGMFRSVWDVGVIISSGIMATVLSSLIAILPTRRALKMRITDSLRFE
ncbi:MAG: FtsX-like permease family protein [Treponema sp.]|nr:FtsX-like permease family protein [Treponema sp.]